jgi:hypothetical protein
LTTLEDLTREGLDVTALPPGTDLILRANVPLDREYMRHLAAQADELGRRLGRCIMVVSHDLDVIVLPPTPTTEEAP